jgi:hypothetical protein
VSTLVRWKNIVRCAPSLLTSKIPSINALKELETKKTTNPNQTSELESDVQSIIIIVVGANSGQSIVLVVIM